MRLSFAARVALSALCVAACGACFQACSSAATAGANIGLGSGGTSATDAGADAGDAGPIATAVTFSLDALTIEPKATRALTVTVTPPGGYLVHFALIGAASDAALDASEVDTDTAGRAMVTLTAPSTPTIFGIRAWVLPKASGQLGVSVSASNYTTLRVLPSYGGKRTVTTWTATVAAGVSCEQLGGDPPADGALSTTAPRDADLDIVKVPVGVDLAVTLRAGHYIGGCANLSALSEADGNTVQVHASDRPVNLDASLLDVSFGPTDPSGALSKLMTASVTQAESALTGGATSDVTALLDAMRDSTVAANRGAFSAARQTHTWDAALTAAFGEGATTRLRAPAARWLGAGLARFYAADTFAGQLGPRTGGAQLKVVSVAAVPASAAGLASSFQATWSADSNDTLLLGTTLGWVPSRLVTALAVLPAIAEVPAATSVEAALAQSVDCTLVGQTLVANGTTIGSATYDGCDEGCSESACVVAVAALWRAASNASGSTSASLTLTATGPAQVGDDASVTSLTGSWVGQLQVDTDTAPLAGPFTASATPASN